MGSRGSTSASGKKASKKNTKQEELKGVKAKLKEFEDKGVSVEGNWDLVDNKATEDTLSGALDILNEFPQAHLGVINSTSTDLKYSTYAGASRSKPIFYINANKYKNEEDVYTAYYSDVVFGFHPKGTTAADIGAHEIGHLLEQAIRNKYISDPIQRLTVAENRTVAKNIVSTAAKAAKKTTEGKGKRIAELVASVSGYAKANRSETLAECVADYHANGENANILSREVWKILKQELG